MNSMKNIRKKIALICLLCFSFLLTGCKIGNKEVIVSNTLNNRQVFRIGNVSCGLKEAKVYLVNYQNIYGTAYGLDLWQHDFGDSSLENYVKNITMRELAQVVCLDQLAKEKEMELSEEEKVLVARARKVQRFLSQPFHVAETFTGVPGKYVPLKETIRGFKAIIDGEMDDYPENAFFNVGTIEDVIEKAKTL